MFHEHLPALKQMPLRISHLAFTGLFALTVLSALPRLQATEPTPSTTTPSTPSESSTESDAESPSIGDSISDKDVVEFFAHYCLDCHQGEDAESGLDLERFKSGQNVVDAIEAFNKVADRIAEGQMPPEGSQAPPKPLKDSVVKWIRETIHQAVCDDGVTPGGPIIRRLSRTEYANTVRDLLGIRVNAGHALPSDGAGGEGFDNAAETLFISPIYAEKYLDAAREALEHALKDPRPRRQLIIAEPDDKLSPSDAARRVLERFLPRAFRRPLRDNELADYVQLFEHEYKASDSYLSAIQFALEAAMVSPKFLMLIEAPNEGDEAQLLSHYEMANRLSYFMWASMPDDELFSLAEQKKLHDPDVLKKQVARMLHSRVDSRGLRRDSKVRGFAESFTEQWLGTRALGREFRPDQSIARGYDSELEGGMKYEPVFFFEDLLSENRSLLNWIDSDFTYTNRRLARHYGIKGEFREQPKKVELPEDSHRGGVLGMSAVLAVSSYPHRTSPVLRGKWILETLLGTPPPPPPPGVPELEENGEAAQPTSLREKLELHRADPACNSCHSAMDPLGFGLENFDVLGRWRKDVDGLAIDARGELPSGESFDGPEELKRLLMSRKQQFMRNLTRKLLGFALSRGLTNEDACVVESILEKTSANDFLAHEVVFEIIHSTPFRYKKPLDPSAT
jgi:hypothetical protein